MKIQRIARLLAIVLTLVTMVSCMAVLMTTPVFAGNYKVITAQNMWDNDSPYGYTASLSNGVYKITATDNDPYTQFGSLTPDNIFQTYPYVVVRYRTSSLSTMEFFCGHPNNNNCRVSMPVVPTNGQWGVLFYDFSVVPKDQRNWFRWEPLTVNGETLEVAEMVFFDTLSDADAYGYVYANAGYRSGATGGCVVMTHNDFDYWGNANGRTGENNLSGIDIARHNNGRFKDGGYYTRLTFNGGDPYVHFNNNTTFKNAATSYTYCSVRYRTNQSGTMRIYTEWDGTYSATAGITGDTTWRWATVTLKDDGSASTFRIDPLDAGTSGKWFDVAEIVFHNGNNNIYNADFGNSSNRNNNGDGRAYNVRMYVLHRDNYTYFENSSSVSKISTGSLAGNYRENQTANFRYGSNSRSVVGRTFYYVAGTHSAHQDNGGTVTVQATCTAAGSTRYNCTLCNDQTRVDSTKPAALGHNTSGSVTHKDATCTETGVVGGTYCTRCNNGKTAAEASIAALGHNKEGSVAHKDPTCTATGVVGGTYCARCNDGKAAVEAIIAALGHNAEGSVAHKDATCTETGVVGGTYCNRCNDGKAAVEAIIAALGHNAEGSVAHKDATCTETGVVGGTYCNRCNDGKAAVEAIIAALGHNAEGTVAHKDATCTETGVVGGTYCARCNDGKAAVEAIIAALGHDEVVDAAVAPYCTTTGKTEGKHCDRCKVTLIAQEIVAALGHVNVVDAAVAATCTETGLTEGCHCSRCEEVLTKQNVVDALGHDEKIDAAVAPYCTTTGKTEGKHCDRCKVILIAQEIIDALGHAEVVDAAVAPYCTTTGLTEGKHCNRCEVVLIAQNVVDALGHEEVADAAVAADCTNAGKTAGKHCNRCSEILLAQEIIEALGHDIIVKPGKPASYTETGLSDGTKCSRCAEMDSEQEVLPKKNPLLSYNVALGEQFAVNMKYVAFVGVTIKVVDEEGTEYAFTVTENVGTHTDGLAIYSIRIADISAQDIGHVFTVSEAASGYSTGVSVKGYCDQVDALYGNKTEEEIAAGFVAAGYDAATAQAMAAKTVLAHATTKKMDLYGQAAENYFNQAGADHDGLATLIGESYTATDSSKTVNNTGDVIFKGATVVFGDHVELLFKMQNYKNEKIYVNGVEVPENEISQRLTTDGTYVYFSILVTPDEYSTAFTVRAGSHVLGESGYYGNSSYVVYSVDTYITSMQTKYATDESEKGKATVNLVNALGHYGSSAIAYKEG